MKGNFLFFTLLTGMMIILSMVDLPIFLYFNNCSLAIISFFKSGGEERKAHAHFG